MIKVMFFASIREQLECSELCIEDVASMVDKTGLIDSIARLHGDKFKEVLSGEKVLTSLNHEMIKGDFEIRQGDEVGFFPPVTGG